MEGFRTSILFLFDFRIFAAGCSERETPSTSLLLPFFWTRKRFDLKTGSLVLFWYIDDRLFDWLQLQFCFNAVFQFFEIRCRLERLSMKSFLAALFWNMGPVSSRKCISISCDEQDFRLTRPLRENSLAFITGTRGLLSRGNWRSCCTGSISGERNFWRKKFPGKIILVVCLSYY